MQIIVTRHSLDLCEHRNLSEISMTDNLPAITGDISKYYEAFCNDCEEIVYCQTGLVVIPWTTVRNIAWRDTSKDKSKINA